MKITRRLGEKRWLIFRYPNLGLAPIDVWVAEPPTENAVQTGVRLTYRSLQPVDRQEVGGNLVALYHVFPFHTLVIKWAFTTVEPSLESGVPSEPSSLDPDARAIYLRPSLQIGRGEEIVGEAVRLKGEKEDTVAIARAFYDELIANYAYKYPLRRRGALTMQHSQRGDCGQFSALFVAWCRAVGIPAREVVGALVHVDAMNPHVWAEFYLEGVGWVPVDPSMGNALARQSGNAAAEATFGHLRPIRFAFSTDVDLPLPAYGGNIRPVPVMTLLGGRIGFEGRTLLWGYGTLDGAVPYLQPAYPRGYRGTALTMLFAPAQIGYWAASKRELRRQAIGQATAQVRGFVVVVAFLLFVAATVLHGPPAEITTGVAAVLIVLLLIASLTYQRPWMRLRRLGR